MTALTLAVDLGGTRMRAALVDPDGAIRARTTVPTPRDQPCGHAVHEVMRAMADESGGGDADSVVVGVPGRVDYGAGRLEYAPNLPDHWLKDLDAESLGDTIGRPVAVANDGDMAAVGEAFFGAGRGHRDVVYVTFSTGVGAGVVLDGRLVRGRRSLAEIGHTSLRVNNESDHVSTVEQLASGTALARAAQSAGVARTGAELVALVLAGDPAAAAVFDGVAVAIAATVVNLAHLFSPEIVVVGGGLGRNLNLLRLPIAAAFDRAGPRGLPEPVLVAEALLGDDSGLVGAAGWARATRAPR